MNNNLFREVCSYRNLELAHLKARKNKTSKEYVKEFEQELPEQLVLLGEQLALKTYRPLPLKTFIIRDPKTRIISKSAFRDRIVHHALCNVIEPVFERVFIHDSYANRKGKGTHAALERFRSFSRKESRNGTRACYVLKADIRKYFQNVDQELLLSILAKRVKDEHVLAVIRKILENHNEDALGKGMPLGNLTSQFFANVYLNELDQYVKHKLKVKHYIRYVDDFVIISNNRQELEQHQDAVDSFLKTRLMLNLHPDKCRVRRLKQGIDFLGFRVFPNHVLIRKRNLRKHHRKFEVLGNTFKAGFLDEANLRVKMHGWFAYISYANTHKYAKKINREMETLIESESTKPLPAPAPPRKQEKYTAQETLLLYKQGFSVERIASERNIKPGTVWSHFEQLIRHGHLPLRAIVPLNKQTIIVAAMRSDGEKLLSVKKRLHDATITFDEIACVRASLIRKTRLRMIAAKKWKKKGCSVHSAQ